MPGIDSFTKLMLHMDGDDASTTFTDSSLSPYTMSAVADAQIDTAQSVFGGASGKFDGALDKVTAVDSADWILDGGDDANTWTVDFRIRSTAANQNYGVLSHNTDSNNAWSILWLSSTIRFLVRSSGTNIVDVENSVTDANDTWYHLAFVKNGTTGYLTFQNGTQVGVTEVDTSLIPNFTGTLDVGRAYNGDGSDKYFNGWIDELRISKGIARWTADFTPPTAAYSGTSVINRMMLMGIS